MLSILVTGCASKPPAEPSTSETPTSEASETTNEPTNSNEITDMAGRTVVLPDQVNTIATPNVDAYRILVQLGAADKLIGAPNNMYGSKYSESDTIEVVAWPDVKQLEKVGGGPPGSEINVEALIALKPDLIISWSYGKDNSSVEIADKIQQQSGIPVICLNNISKAQKDLQGIRDAYTLMGKVAGKEEEAADLIHYYEEQVKFVEDTILSANLAPKTVYMCGSSSILRKSNNYLPIQQLHLKNVVTEAEKEAQEIAKEQLVQWNPDLIFMHTPAKNFRVNMEEVRNDPVLKNLNAVKSNSIYHIKANYMGWDIATGLVDLYYMAKLSYPELFPDLNVPQKGDEILETFYHQKGLYALLEENNGFYPFPK